MTDKLASLEILKAEYPRLTSENDKSNFSKIIAKLLSKTYLVKYNDDDKMDYFFIQEHKSLIEAYFDLADFEFAMDKGNGIAYLKTNQGRLRERLNKMDTLILLNLRRIYIKKMKEITLSDYLINVDVNTLIEEMKSISSSKDMNKTVYYETLRKLRRHNIVFFTGSSINENTRIVIYPSIQLVINQDSLESIKDRIKALNNQRDENKEEEFYEETDEN